jgi:hypothetical protein
MDGTEDGLDGQRCCSTYLLRVGVLLKRMPPEETGDEATGGGEMAGKKYESRVFSRDRPIREENGEVLLRNWRTCCAEVVVE